MMKKRGIGILCILFMVFQIVTINVYPANQPPSRQINVVYDDSGSMYNTHGQVVDTWCQAKYSMEVFASMLGENDKMNIYYMSDYQNGAQSGPRIMLDGKDDVKSNVKKIHDQTTTAGNTPFASVQKAYADLTGATADEKWLVILTDGDFQGVNGKAGVDAYLAQKDAKVKVLFLGMGPDAAGITSNDAANISYVEAKSNSDILSQVTKICTRIYNSNKLEIDASSKKFSFDVPMKELTVFAQGADVKIKGLKNEKGKALDSDDSPAEVKYSNCDALNYKNEPTKDLVGEIVTFKGDYSPGDYVVDASGAETIEVYYKPNIEVEATLFDSSGTEVTDLENLAAGDYSLTFNFVKAGTKEAVKQSKLLGKVNYEASITNNGNVHEKKYGNGDVVTLEEGPLTIDVIAHYLDYNTVSTRLDYSIFKDKEITFEIVDNPTYVVEKDGLKGKSPIKIKALIDGKEPTPEQWTGMNLPKITLDKKDHDFKIELSELQKTEEPGVFTILPSLPGGKASSGVYDECAYSVSYKQKVGEEIWSGSGKGSMVLNDQRSWWDQNKSKVIRYGIMLAILLLLAGYLPFFKHYLPKSLKRKPYVKCIPSEPGEKRKDRNGVVDKNLGTTILPYVSQTGTIKYVPKGVTGAPALEVKATKNHQMILTNLKKFMGKNHITFDGETISPETKKYVFSANTNITVKKGAWTYTCNLNQEN